MILGDYPFEAGANRSATICGIGADSEIALAMTHDAKLPKLSRVTGLT